MYIYGRDVSENCMPKRSAIGANNRDKEVFSEEFILGNLKIEVVIQKENNHHLSAIYTAHLTAKDENDRRLWSTPIIDDLVGGIKTYPSIFDAMADARKKLGL